MISAANLYALCGAALIGIGLYGFVARRHLLRRVIAFNVTGSGIFLLFGATAWRRPDLGSDPVPQALIITGIVVALAATALVVTLITRHAELSGQTTLPEEADEEPAAQDDGRD
ncbi:cation:proton antiporter subunit C [Hydrogenophaga sp.]|uniref:cation:proton antiporter subunit C n=1 Tax=Hydrogenophaga sp. TaxID=1904254 RepID=UPI0027160CAF|nr:cation:proton antiporter subunit C [Hydrogenophaga sp.]MDO8904812.1 cation:proton antiporter subunit C [Hydrogenophaga sp.]